MRMMLEILASFFYANWILRLLRFRKKKFNLGLKGIIEKCVGCFLVYLVLGAFFLLKNVKKCVCAMGLKNAMLPMKSVFINVKKGINELGASLAAKHTTNNC